MMGRDEHLRSNSEGIGGLAGPENVKKEAWALGHLRVMGERNYTLRGRLCMGKLAQYCIHKPTKKQLCDVKRWHLRVGANHFSLP